jgi:hypothetical protein
LTALAQVLVDKFVDDGVELVFGILKHVQSDSVSLL